MVPVTIVSDVIEAEPLRYDCLWVEKYLLGLGAGIDKSLSSCRIHVRSVDDVLGAGWNHGKFGRGITTRIDK